MTILELNFESGWRGGERQTIFTMIGFRNAGIATHLVCRKGSQLEAKAKQEGFVTHAFDSTLGVIFFLIGKGRKYDLIHAQASQILTYCIFTKLFHGKKVLFTRRVNFIQKGFLTKLKYRFTDRIIAISNAIQKTVTEFTGRTDVEMISSIIVKKDLDTTKAKAILSSLNIAGKYIIATTSALASDKDPLTMVEAIKILSEKRNDIVFLHFGVGNLKDVVAQKINEYNLQQTYILMGFVENVEAFFPSFNIFTMSSEEEGLGSSVLDAFINKVPVVSTNAGGLADLLKDERGFLCEIRNGQALANGIETVLDNPEQREKYISNAFNYVESNHDMKRQTDKYIELFKHL
ncbi:glycosyltransferase [Ferruginibacter sp. SUN002]|uniref:glycosyltransferase n=1 Tax=Ferruginibacter sp. SUN002 TaxID=2937789 RepID=UPI003D3604A1